MAAGGIGPNRAYLAAPASSGWRAQAPRPQLGPSALRARQGIGDLTRIGRRVSEREFDEVVAARETRSAAADLLSLAQDAETGQRG
jgi:hypothetical protein